VLSRAPQSFGDAMRSRHAWAETFSAPRPGLAALEDKLAWHDLAVATGAAPRPPVFFRMTNEDNDFEDKFVDNLQRIAQENPLSRVCVKPAHLTTGAGIFFVDFANDFRISMPKPTGPGAAEMARDQRQRQNSVTLPQLAKAMRDALSQKADDPRNAQPLRSVPPCVFVEEQLESVVAEVRALLIFGQLVGLATDTGPPATWPALLRGSLEEEIARSAEALAAQARSDVLRVDFLIAPDGRFFLNEGCAWLWPDDGFFEEKVYAQAFDLLQRGYGQVLGTESVATSNTTSVINEENTSSNKLSITPLSDALHVCTQNYVAEEGPAYQTAQVHFYILKLDGAAGGVDSSAGSPKSTKRTKVAVFDTGCGDVSVLEALRRALDVDLNSLDVHVFITHGHADHVGGLRGLEHFMEHVTVYAHELERPRLQAVLGPDSAVFNEITWMKSGVDGNLSIGGGLVELVTRESSPGGGSSSILQATGVEAFATPGHTSGSLSFFVKGVGCFAGDAFLDSRDSACLMFVSDPPSYASSLARLAALSEKENVPVFVGHGVVGAAPERVKAGAAALSKIVESGAMDLSREAVIAEHGWRRVSVGFDAYNAWVEWDDALGCPVVQAGSDFVFARLSEEHDK